MVNLIDSPGHVDFSGEVSAAVRLCDGALILVDVIEGICPQTKTALKQAWTEGLKPVLVLNKMDRLILEKKLSPLDAYVHLQQIVEQINAIVGVLFTSDLFESSTLTSENKEQPVNIQVEPDDQQYDWSSGIELTDDSQVYFAPESGNVVFASAIDGWGFTIDLFSQFLTKKLSINKDTLLRTLWGDYYFDSKRKRIFKGAQAKAKKPLFVQMVLENIWSAYETIAVKRDVIATEKIVKSLSLSVLPRDLNNSDPKVSIQAIFGQWLPLASSLLDVVCKLLPSPLELTEKRAERLMCSNLKRFENLPKETQLLKNDFVSCSAADDVTKIICISKMVCVDRKLLPENKPRFLSHEEIAMRREQAKAKQLLAQESNHLGSSSGTEITESQLCAVEEDKDIFIAFARVFSGTVRQGDEFYVLGPKYDPAARTSEGDINADHTLLDLGSKQHVTKTKLGRLFVLMGRELESIDCVPAGNVVGIADLDEHVLKSATLSTSLFCPPFVDLHVPAPPILKVAIEPQNPNEMAQLVKGLKLLDQADPNVLVKLEDNGEHVIITTGEVHLQKCVDDLSEHFAKIKLNVSKPIVPFKETIAHPRKIDMVNEVIDERNFAVKDANGHEGNGTLQVFTPNKKSFIKMRAVPLPESVTELLEKHKTLLKQLSSKNSHKDDIASATHDLRELLRIEFSNAGTPWSSDSVDKIWSFGPKYCGPNILFNNVEAYNRSCVWDSTKLSDESIGLLSKYDSSFVGGFQLASQSGPLCEEPMIGVGFVVDEWEMSPELEGQASDPHGPISGQIMSTVKDACRRSFQAQPQRLRIAMYSCTIQVASEALGESNEKIV